MAMISLRKEDYIGKCLSSARIALFNLMSYLFHQPSISKVNQNIHEKQTVVMYKQGNVKKIKSATAKSIILKSQHKTLF